MSTPPIGLERKRQPTRWALMSHTSQAGESFFFFFRCWNVSQYYYLYRCVVVFSISALMLCFFFFFDYLVPFSLSFCTSHRPCFVLPFFFLGFLSEHWCAFWCFTVVPCLLTDLKKNVFPAKSVSCSCYVAFERWICAATTCVFPLERVRGKAAA